jgi:hypothetical protein
LGKRITFYLTNCPPNHQPNQLYKGNRNYRPESNKLFTKIQRLTTFLGLQKSTVGMFFMVIQVGMGERMLERFLPIYLTALGGGQRETIEMIIYTLIQIITNNLTYHKSYHIYFKHVKP